MKNSAALPEFLLARTKSLPPSGAGPRFRAPMIERGVRHTASLIARTFEQWDTARRTGVLQRVDARVKLASLIAMLVVISLKRTLVPLVAAEAALLMIAALSGIGFMNYARRVLLFAIMFGFVVAAPSSLNIITPGAVVLPIAGSLGISRPGAMGVALLTMRVMCSVSAALLILYSTPLAELLRALRVLRVPDAVVLMISLAYKYIFLLAHGVERMHLAVKARLGMRLKNNEARRWASGRMAALFIKSREQCEELYKAMLARGFQGEVRLRSTGGLGTLDIMAALIAAALIATVAAI